MDEDEKQHVIDLEADIVDLNDNLDSVNEILAGTKLAAEERADKEKLKALDDINLYIEEMEKMYQKAY